MQPHEFWQDLHSGDDTPRAPYGTRYPARLPDGRVLFLPIRALGETGTGIASLILNQAAFAVEAALADALAERIASSAPDIVVGMPTLGLSLARDVALRLGHGRYVALGTSRKFWYDEAISTPLNSITSPDAKKRLYLDPRMLPLLEGARVCLIDDVISSGTSIAAGLRLLRDKGVEPVSIGAAMAQTRRWAGLLDRDRPGTSAKVQAVLRTPLLCRDGGGWIEKE